VVPSLNAYSIHSSRRTTNSSSIKRSYLEEKIRLNYSIKEFFLHQVQSMHTIKNDLHRDVFAWMSRTIYDTVKEGCCAVVLLLMFFQIETEIPTRRITHLNVETSHPPTHTIELPCCENAKDCQQCLKNEQYFSW